MNADELRALQTPIKNRYKEDPASAKLTLSARGTLGLGDVTCSVATPRGATVAGLHPATGGDGKSACSADMLLESLAGCAGVTASAVATALGIPIRGGSVVAEGDLDFRGTLGVAKDAPVGFSEIRLRFEFDSDAEPDQLAKLVQVVERYCVVLQTLKNPPKFEASIHKSA